MAGSPGTRAAGAARWRLLLGGGAPDALACGGAWNMAVDDAILAAAAAGGPPTLRFYRWRPACLSVGRNQAIRGALAPGELARRGWHVVRRPTGGLAVLHAEELTYCVAGTVETLGRPRAAYAAISAALAEGLRDLGLAASVACAPPGPAAALPTPARSAGSDGRARRGAAPGYLAGPEARCFAAAAPGEVTARGRKILGSAQRRAGKALLQHGSLLLAGSQEPVGELIGALDPADRADAPPASRPRSETTVAEELGRVPPDERIIGALAAAFARRLAPELVPGSLSASERTLAERRSRAYSSQAWTWRR